MDDQLLIVGLCGVARSGKDSVARYLGVDHGFTRIALADGVRESFRSLDGASWELTKDLEAAGLTQRWALQTLGTEAREALTIGGANRYHWVDLVMIKIRYLAFHHPRPLLRFVIPDVRFPHESGIARLYCRQWGGHYETWKLTRPGSGLSGDAAKHKSETSVSEVRADRLIVNGGTLLDLREAVDMSMEMFLANASKAEEGVA